MVLQESGEMYLEAIYVLSANVDGVHSVDVGKYLGFSKPSVSRAVGLLKNGGYLNVDDEGHLTLTELGLEIAKKTFERHKLLADFFVSIGVDQKTADEDACKIEHHISDETFKALKNHLNK